MFNELSPKAYNIVISFEAFMAELSFRHGIDYKEPMRDIAERFLNDIVGFVPEEEEKRSSLKPWEEG